MTADNETFQQPAIHVDSDAPTPGVLVISSAKSPVCIPHRLDRPVTIGRNPDADLSLPGDIAISGKHAVVSHSNGRWNVRDLSSRYGTYANGARVVGEQTFDAPPIVRVGDTLIECRANIGPYDVPTRVDGDYVVSPHTRRAIAGAAWAARYNVPLLIRGESGSGKERIAKAFHQQGPRASGNFVSISATDLDESIAGAELFGAKKGAFTGATDRKGLIAEADGGTLFIDELAELPLMVQVKLLRVFTEKEVRALGGNTTHVVDFALVVATNMDLEQAIADKRFREELYARVDQANVTLLPLHERRDEIPFLIASHPLVRTGAVTVTADFIEACVLRVWRRNVRSLEGAIVKAAQKAGTLDRPRTELVPSDLPQPEASDEDERDKLIRMLRESNGNASELARRLGVPKTTVASRLRALDIR